VTDMKNAILQKYRDEVNADHERKHGESDPEAVVNQTRETFPIERNVTDPSEHPLWSFTIWPRNFSYLDDNVVGFNNSWLNSKIVIENVTYNLHNDVLQITDNPLPGRDSSGKSRPTFFAYGNATYWAYEIEDMGSCLPSDEYIWGFSSLMLFTFCMITIAVALLLITLHYDAYFNSAADRYKLSISSYRDVLDLAEDLRAHYGAAQAAEMPAKELDKAMREDPVATGLETDTLHRSRRARWKQAKASKTSFTRNDARKRSKMVESRAATDAEESLMSMGLDAHLHSEMEMAKLPARVASRSSNGT
jgi:hypothetical protein